MVSKFECPRCGSGIKPNDIQCDRCGEMLKVVPNKYREPAMAAITLDKVFSEEKTSVRIGSNSPEYLSLARMKRMLEEKQEELTRKERALAEREKEMISSLSQIEDDTKMLEEALRNYEEDASLINERERALREREAHIEAISEKFDKGIDELIQYQEVAKDATISKDELEKIKAKRENYFMTLDEQRARIRAELERDLAEELSKLDELKEEAKSKDAQLKAANSLVSELEAKIAQSPAPIVEDVVIETELSAKEIEAISKEIFQELDDQLSDTTDYGEMKVMKTSLSRLDSILGGGIPVGHTVLFNGSPGTMKSTLTYSILYNMARTEGVSGLYFSLEQNRDSLLRQMARMGMPIENVDGKLVVVDMVDLRKKMVDETGDWRSILLRYVKNVHAEMGFKAFVLDSLESFRAVSEYEFTRQDLKDLFDWFKSLGITIFVISESVSDEYDEGTQGEMYLADGVIELRNKEIRDTLIQRWFRCVKMRGMNVDNRYYSLFFDGHTLSLSLPLVDSG